MERRDIIILTLIVVALFMGITIYLAEYYFPDSSSSIGNIDQKTTLAQNDGTTSTTVLNEKEILQEPITTTSIPITSTTSAKSTIISSTIATTSTSTKLTSSTSSSSSIISTTTSTSVKTTTTVDKIQYIYEKTGWKITIYPNSGTLYSIATLNGEYLKKDDIVAAFVDGECRAGFVVTAINGGISYSSLVINGVKPETVNFKMYKASNGEYYDSSKTIINVPGERIGFPPEPFFNLTFP